VDDRLSNLRPDIANAILAIARKIGANGWQANYAGVTHLAGPDAVKWCSFARRILQASETNRNRLMASMRSQRLTIQLLQNGHQIPDFAVIG
jgi:dTDP-4-dehydrorhamnose reductase